MDTSYPYIIKVIITIIMLNHSWDWNEHMLTFWEFGSLRTGKSLFLMIKINYFYDHPKWLCEIST